MKEKQRIVEMELQDGTPFIGLIRYYRILDGIHYMEITGYPPRVIGDTLPGDKKAKRLMPDEYLEMQEELIQLCLTDLKEHTKEQLAHPEFMGTCLRYQLKPHEILHPLE